MMSGSEITARAHRDVIVADPGSGTDGTGAAQGREGIGLGLVLEGMTVTNAADPVRERSGQNAAARDVVSEAGLGLEPKGGIGHAHGPEAAFGTAAGTGIEETALARDYAPIDGIEVVHGPGGNGAVRENLRGLFPTGMSHGIDPHGNGVAIELVTGTEIGIGTGTGVETVIGSAIVTATVIATVIVTGEAVPVTVTATIATGGLDPAHGKTPPPYGPHFAVKKVTTRSGSARNEQGARRKPRHTSPRKRMPARKVYLSLVSATGLR
jgi:hypothetical protein